MPGFYIDIYNAQGQKLNDTIVEVSNVRLTERVNRIGEITFSLPAVVARDAALTKGRRYRVYHETLGYLGEFSHDDIEVDAENRTATVRALDSLSRLADICVGFNWAYSDALATTVINDLCQYAGWTVQYETGVDLGRVTIEFAGESVLGALDAVRYATRGYFRRAGDTAIKVGKFTNIGATWSEYGGFVYGGGRYKGDLSAIPAETRAWLINPAVASARPPDAPYAVITRIRRQQKGGAVVNRVIPVGAGRGQTQIDLRYSTRTSPYPIKSRLNRDGVSYTYYIEDEASIAQYGAIERMLPFSDVRPITNSQADLLAAANALYDMAVAYLQRFRAPQEVYTISCVDLPAAAQVGEIVVVQYYGVVETESGARAFLTLENAPFYIIERTIDFGESGTPQYELTISTSGEAVATVIDVFSNILKDIDKFKVRPTPSQTYYSKASPTMPIAPGRDAYLKFGIGSEVLLLNEMRVEFTLMPLRSPTSNIGQAAQQVQTTSAGGGTVVTTESGGGATQTTSDGGATVQTTSAGGATVTATNSANTSHRHGFLIGPASGGRYLVTDGFGINYLGSGQVYYIATDYGGGMHEHTVTIPAHTHTVSLPPHTHTVTIPAHTHDLLFGVVDDTQTPQNVTVWVNGVQVGNIRRADTGQFAGNAVSGEGTFVVDILPTLLNQGDWRNRLHEVKFVCGGGRGQVFAQIRGRVTIQPIRVTD